MGHKSQHHASLKGRGSAPGDAIIVALALHATVTLFGFHTEQHLMMRGSTVRRRTGARNT